MLPHCPGKVCVPPLPQAQLSICPLVLGRTALQQREVTWSLPVQCKKMETIRCATNLHLVDALLSCHLLLGVCLPRGGEHVLDGHFLISPWVEARHSYSLRVFELSKMCLLALLPLVASTFVCPEYTHARFLRIPFVCVEKSGKRQGFFVRQRLATRTLHPVRE
jgi:hypothetical protein